MGAYCEAYDVRQELAVGSGAGVISADWERVLDQMAEECSRLIDHYCGLEEDAFLATSSETRYVDGNGRAELWLPWPATSISAVAVDEDLAESYTSWTQGTDYFRWPYQDSGAPSNSPITRLDVNRLSTGSKSHWTLGQRTVQIAGVWGYSTSPPDLVTRACKQQVAQWYKLAMQGWSDTGGTPEMGELNYPRKLDPALMKLIEPYRQYPI